MAQPSPNPSMDQKRDDRGNVSDSYETLKSDITKLSQSVKTAATEKIGDAAGNVQETIQRQVGVVETQFRNHPLQSTMIAAGVGLVVGLLISR